VKNFFGEGEKLLFCLIIKKGKTLEKIHIIEIVQFFEKIKKIVENYLNSEENF
jgi:hypothetical protein